MKIMYSKNNPEQRSLYWCWLGYMHDREYVLFVGLYYVELRISWAHKNNKN